MTVVTRGNDGRFYTIGPDDEIEGRLLQRLAKLVAQEVVKHLASAQNELYRALQQAANTILPGLSHAAAHDARADIVTCHRHIMDDVMRHAQTAYKQLQDATTEWRQGIQTSGANLAHMIDKVSSTAVAAERLAAQAQAQVVETARQQQVAVGQFLEKIQTATRDATTETLTGMIGREIADLELRKLIRDEVGRVIRQTVREVLGEQR